jgi:hypothetical protein
MTDIVSIDLISISEALSNALPLWEVKSGTTEVFLSLPKPKVTGTVRYFNPNTITTTINPHIDTDGFHRNFPRVWQFIISSDNQWQVNASGQILWSKELSINDDHKDLQSVIKDTILMGIAHITTLMTILFEADGLIVNSLTHTTHPLMPNQIMFAYPSNWTEKP